MDGDFYKIDFIIIGACITNKQHYICAGCNENRCYDVWRSLFLSQYSFSVTLQEHFYMQSSSCFGFSKRKKEKVGEDGNMKE